MTFSSLRLLFIATGIILFVHVAESDVRCQTVDVHTLRHGLHSCPPGQFVIGVQVRENLLLCSQSFGTYDSNDEITDGAGGRSRGTQQQDMHACPEGMAMTGLNVRSNILACAPVSGSTPRFVDISTVREAGGVQMRSCPDTPVAGIHVSRNLLLCGSGSSSGNGPYLDTSTQRHGMHSCPQGQFITGIHVRNNLLRCSTAFGTYPASSEIVDSRNENYRGIQQQGMHACAQGMAMTGIDVRNNALACAPVAESIPREVDTGTVAQTGDVSIHICARGPVSGIHVSRNLLLCGTRGGFDTEFGLDEFSRSGIRVKDEFVDAGTQRHGMHSCVRGFVVGVHVTKNLLLCSTAFGDFATEDEMIVKMSEARTCPDGMAMTGIRHDRGEITCARVSVHTGSPLRRVVDFGTQRFGMHACPRGRPASGFRGNVLFCGTHGEPIFPNTITGISLGAARLGDMVVIDGYQLGSVLGPDGVHSVTLKPQRLSNNSSPGSSQAILQWQDDRILIMVGNVTPGEYLVATWDRNHQSSKSFPLYVQVPPADDTVGDVNGPRVTRVEPRIAVPGAMLDVFGEFSNLSADTAEVRVWRLRPDGTSPPQVQTLHPATVGENYLRVRLPIADMLAGEWAIAVRRTGGSDSGARRFFICDTAWSQHSRCLASTQ